MMMTRRARKRRQRWMTAMKTLRWRRPGEEGETETESGTALTPLPLHQKMMNPMTTPANTVAFPTIPSWCDTLLQKYLHLLTVRSAAFNPSFPFPQILLCDSCDSGYHTACLRPPLMIIPDGEWFCPPCQHVSPFRFQDSLYRKTQFWLFKY